MESCLTNLRITSFDVENTGMTVEFETYELFRRGGHHLRWQDIKTPRELFSFQAKPFGKKPIWGSVVDKGGKEGMVKAMHKVLSETDVLLGWNSKRFDWKKAQHAFFMAGLPRIPEPYHVDLMMLCKRYFDFESNSLGYVSSQLLGADEAKIDLQEASVKSLIDRIKKGDRKALALLKVYGLRDVTVLEALWPFFTEYISLPHANPAAASAEDGDKVCPMCGGANTIGRGSRRTLQGVYPRRQCLDDQAAIHPGKRPMYTVTRSTAMAHSRSL
jgi:hypothetical protein